MQRRALCSLLDRRFVASSTMTSVKVPNSKSRRVEGEKKNQKKIKNYFFSICLYTHEER